MFLDVFFFGGGAVLSPPAVVASLTVSTRSGCLAVQAPVASVFLRRFCRDGDSVMILLVWWEYILLVLMGRNTLGVMRILVTGEYIHALFLL